MSNEKTRYAIWAIIAVIVIGTFIWRRRKRGKSLFFRERSRNVSLDTSVSNQKLVYSNGDSITLYDAWRGSIPSTSVFSPDRTEWYFDISGLDNTGKVIFSTGWHNNVVLRQNLPKFEDIKRWQITVATDLSAKPSDNVFRNLRVE